MKKLFILLPLAISLLGCNSNTAPKEDAQSSEEVAPNPAPKDDCATLLKELISESDGIKLYAFNSGAEYPEAALTQTAPVNNASIKSGEKVKFSYTMTGFELSSQTQSGAVSCCNNSQKGQHIHWIINNKPYFASYKPDIDTLLEDGRYLALSFLSRSYHESIKNGTAFQLMQFTVGKTPDKPYDLTAPYLFYSRPKGEYKGADTKNLLFDFYLANTTLSPEGNQVKLTIDGKQSFTITKWQPYILQGLSIGKHTLVIDLVDKDGKHIGGAINTTTREILLSEETL